MARSAKLELDIDSTKARAGAGSATRELRDLKRAGAESYDSLRRLAGAGASAGTGMRSAASGASTADKEMRKARSEAAGLDREMRRVASSAGLMGGSMRISAGSVNGLAGSLLALKSAALVVIAIGLAKTILDSADATKQWVSQLKLAIPATVSLAQAQADVRRITMDTRGPMAETNELYAKFSRASADMGKTQDQAARATETFNKTMKISGADTAEVTAVTRQFGQALASGVLRGDEFNSVMEGSPRLARLIAESLGVTTGQLRGMAEQGQLTSDKLYAALTDKKFTETIDEEFKLMPVTFGEAMQRIHDTGTVVFGAFDRGGSFSNAIVNFVMDGTSNLDSLEARAEAFGVDVRATFEGLATAFEPIGKEGSFVFDLLHMKIVDLRNDVGNFLGLLDAALNARTALARFEVNASNAPNKFWNPIKQFTGIGTPIPIKPLPEYTSNMRGDFQAQFDRSQKRGQLDAREAQIQNRMRVGGFKATESGSMDAWLEQRDEFKPKKIVPPAASGPKKKKTGGKSDEEREAERLEKLQDKRKQNEANFFQSMQDQVTAASKLPGQAEQYNEELKLRKILNDGQSEGERELTRAQKERIALLLQEKNIAEFVRTGQQEKLNSEREGLRLQDEYLTISKATTASQEDDLEIQRKLWPYKLDAMERGLSLQDETVRRTLAEVEARERGNQELAKRNKLVLEGVDVAKQYGGPGVQRDTEVAELNDKKIAAAEALWAGRITPAVYESTIKGLDQAIYEASNHFRDEFVTAVDQIAGSFSGKFGDVLKSVSRAIDAINSQSKGDFSKSGAIGGIIGLFAGPNGNPVKDSATKASQETISGLLNSKTFTKPFESLSSSFGSFKGDMSNLFGKGGDFTKGLGSVLGKAGAGAQIGGAISDIAGLVGIKLNKTGSQVGGAIGGAAFGPLGAIGGSVLGGIVGNLFTKPKYGTAAISSVDGKASLGGNNADAKAGAGTLAGSVQQGLRTLADALGAKVGGFNVSIGTFDGKYRVSTTGFQGSLDSKKAKGQGLHDFGTDGAAEAVAFAISDAIQDGALQGLSATMQKIIKNAGTDLDKAVSDALKFKNVQDELRSIKDPINYALDNLNKGFEDIIDIMKSAGATSEEWANAEELYQIKRQQIIEDGNNSALKSMKDYLFELSGGQNSVLAPEQRYAAAKKQLDELDTKKAAGGVVDFDTYKAAADAFLAASRDSKGSGLDFFADMKRVTDSVQSMIDKLGVAGVTVPELQFQPVVSSIDSQTQAVTGLLSGIYDTLNGMYGKAGSQSAASVPVTSLGNGGGAGSGDSGFPVYVEEPRYFGMN